jgi:hypothetical protein
MNLVMMNGAEWHGEFIAHLNGEATRLRKSEMMRVLMLSSADQAGLSSDEFEMFFVATASFFGNN